MPITTITEWEADWATHLSIDAAIGDGPADGLIMHAAGPSEAGTRVIDVWESRQHMTRFFNERIVPALHSLGIEAGPPLSVTEYDVQIVRT
jgi:hypothetical protein